MRDLFKRVDPLPLPLDFTFRRVEMRDEQFQSEPNLRLNAAGLVLDCLFEYFADERSQHQLASLR